MTAVANPALEKFIAQIGRELLVAQVLITRLERGYELRHVNDRTVPHESLRLVSIGDLRKLAEASTTGAFRPLKSAPNLQTGWRAVAGSDIELGEALHRLYPGAVADWWAAQTEPPPVTHYRDFTERQTGMYRITTMLDDPQSAQMIRACCDARFCLKQRLWTVTGLDPDPVAGKSMIPCLEPCAVLLEFARKAVRLEQEEKTPLSLSAGEMETLRAALEGALQHPVGADREADFNEPANPRRVQLTLDKLKACSPTTPNPGPESPS